MHLTRTLGVGLIFLGLTCAAAADPLQVTSGRIVFDFEGDWFDMSGNGFAVSTTSGSVQFLSKRFARDCFPCFPGDTLDLSFVAAEQPFGFGPGSVGDTSYPQLFYRTVLSVRTAPLSFPDVGSEPVDVRQPFTMSGVIRAYTASDFSTLAFSLSVQGQGRTQTTYHFDFDSAGHLPEEGQLAYIFEDTAAVPEPMSLVLVGTGMCAIVARRRASRLRDRNRQTF